MIGAELLALHAAHLEKTSREDKDMEKAGHLLARTDKELSRLNVVLAQNGAGNEK